MNGTNEPIPSVRDDLVVESHSVSDKLEPAGDFVAVPPNDTSTRRADWVLPTVLGAILLGLSIYFPTRPGFLWAFQPIGFSQVLNCLLLLTGVVLAVLLFVYANRMRRQQGGPNDSNLSVAKFAVPVLLWLAGMSAITTSFLFVANRYNVAPELKSCVELYADMTEVAKQNPGYRLLSSDPDEARCGINRAVFGG